MNDVLGIIPARGGSKGVPRKNLRDLAGKPLLAYTIEAGLASKSLTRLLLSTEDPEIAQAGAELGIDVLPRDPAFARDDSPMIDVVLHVLEQLEARDYRPAITVLLQPTAPLRRAEHIDMALVELARGQAASVVSVSPVPAHHHPLWQFRIGENGVLNLYTGGELQTVVTRRQELEPTYSRNGAIYAFRTALTLEHGTLYPPPCVALIMSEHDSINIDSEEDFRLAEHRLRAERPDRETGSAL